ncbi:hypothetical protein QCA50_005312 [Cerrena zonata]|uniref:Pseudouridine synthase RsuA/RluA-like domain-containing protein n=1 Tax=Cerrena zonata TaxID=2478898 RepID=A0AAW0GJ74_9APHY
MFLRRMISSQTTRSPSTNRPSRVIYPLINLSSREQFRKVIFSFISGKMIESDAGLKLVKSPPGLRKVAPYWYPYTTMAKERWLGREILEIVSTEFRDRSMEYYRYALESGVTTINGKVAKPDTLVRNGDRIENVVHRHEPPVTSKPVKILHRDEEREFIVIDKPGSIPVHAAGRYHKNSLIEVLKNEYGYKKVYFVNRLDRLTSGLMIVPLSSASANRLAVEFASGEVKKEYIARIVGEFPEEEVTCEEPLLTIDRQQGLNIVHPDGKPAKTIFKRLHYDANTDTSVVHCRPFTGRSHQLRVHLQFLGHPIANDPVYSSARIWGENLGRNGIDTTPSDVRSAPEVPAELQAAKSETSQPESSLPVNTEAEGGSSKTKALPRETGDDIGYGSPVPLSAEAVKVITNLRNLKDEEEDWSRWRDVVFKAKGKLHPHHIVLAPPPPQNRRKRGGPAVIVEPETPISIPSTTPPSEESAEIVEPDPPQLSVEEALEKISIGEAAAEDVSALTTDHRTDLSQPKTKMHYCPECYLPIHPDPKPEKLYIFLHALRYTTSLGCFETDMPEWAAEGWEWDRS